MYERAEIERILDQGESQEVEFKERFPSSEVLGRELAALANTSGGLLLIGISDAGEIVGVPEAGLAAGTKRLQDIASSLLPTPFEIATVDLDGRKILYAVVNSAPDHLRPVMTSRGEIFVREGTRTHRLGSDANAFRWGHEDMVGGATGPWHSPQEVVALVAMSFRDEEEPALIDYYRAKGRAVEASRLPIRLRRIDLVEGDYEISQQVMKEIDAAQLMIVDFTLNARNVYFELDYARGRGCRIIQTARKGTSLEFDVRSWRTLFYRNATELEEKLVGELKAACAQLTFASG